MKKRKMLALLVTLCLILSVSVPAYASTFTDAHGNVIELDDSLEAYSSVSLEGAGNAARKGETNLGDLWTDALKWYATSGKINDAFDEDDIAAGNNKLCVDSKHVVALWNGGNLRDDISIGKFGSAELAKVLPYPNKVAIVYMTGAQLQEALEAASQGLPYTDDTADSLAAFMQVSGLKYTVNANKEYNAGEAYGKFWFKAKNLRRVKITEVNGKAFSKTDTYAVITSNANFNGMDSSYIFKEAATANDKSTVTNAVVRDVVWEYIAEELGNVISDKYASAAGRITIEKTSTKTAEKIKASVSSMKPVAKSQVYKRSNGKKAIKLTVKKGDGYKPDYYEVWRSTKRSIIDKAGEKGSYYKKVTYKKTTSSVYDLNVKRGSKYYYKVRGVREVNGKKVYTKWTSLTYKTVK